MVLNYRHEKDIKRHKNETIYSLLKSLSLLVFQFPHTSTINPPTTLFPFMPLQNPHHQNHTFHSYYSLLWHSQTQIPMSQIFPDHSHEWQICRFLSSPPTLFFGSALNKQWLLFRTSKSSERGGENNIKYQGDN